MYVVLPHHVYTQKLWFEYFWLEYDWSTLIRKYFVHISLFDIGFWLDDFSFIYFSINIISEAFFAALRLFLYTYYNSSIFVFPLWYFFVSIIHKMNYSRICFLSRISSVIIKRFVQRMHFANHLIAFSACSAGKYRH